MEQRVTKMTREEFKALPRRKWDEESICSSLVILPTDRMHDSGYWCMEFVAVDEKGEPMYLVSGGSDVVHLDGIGGYGDRWLEKYGTAPSSITPSGWSIDCLPGSGLLRIWPSSNRIRLGPALSSFEIFAVPKEEDK